MFLYIKAKKLSGELPHLSHLKNASFIVKPQAVVECQDMSQLSHNTLVRVRSKVSRFLEDPRIHDDVNGF